VKFIKQVAAEYDFNIAATKSDVFKFLERNNAGFDIILPIHLTLGSKDFEKIVLLILKKIRLTMME
jgi:hypothetical protein